MYCISVYLCIRILDIALTIGSEELEWKKFFKGETEDLERNMKRNVTFTIVILIFLS